jgi:16S rRNA (adenine1518-N6/adenine1519-N6)-dimethyltransferase
LATRTLNAASDPILDLPPLREVIAQAGLKATKALGQNFLLDLNLTASIAKANGDLTGLSVVEIGPGPGGLTRALLLAGAARVTAIEFDKRAVEALQPLIAASGARLTVHQADATEVDILGYGDTVIANLPYNVATPILIGLLKNISRANFMLLMFQKEVAERIVAKPDSKTFGRLSVLCQWLCKTKIVKTLPPSAFTPPPKVTSSVVLFQPRTLENQPKFETMEKIVATAFNQRRKMLRSSLGDYAQYLEAAKINPTLRAEDVDVDSYVRLAKIVEAA